MASLNELVSEDGYLFHTKKGKPVEAPQALAPLVDTHCHLTCLSTYDAASALVRATLAGVSLVIVPVDPVEDFAGGSSASVAPDVPAFFTWLEGQVATGQEMLGKWWRSASPCPHKGTSMPDRIADVRIVAGVHPYGARRFLHEEIVRRRMEALLESSFCVGVGEIGLDFGPYNSVDGQEQLACFRSQLSLACERDLPVELHIRDAKDDEGAQAHRQALQLLREVGMPPSGCDLHCFTSGPEVMHPFVELGCHIAFGGAASFKRSDGIRDAVAACPSNLLLCETDSPYMAPVPLRGQECEPAMVAFSAALIADVREEAGVALRRDSYRSLWDNARSFFRV